MTREYFASLEPRPDDPILGLVELYKNDPRDTKVNLGVGIYLDLSLIHISEPTRP